MATVAATILFLVIPAIATTIQGGITSYNQRQEMCKTQTNIAQNQILLNAQKEQFINNVKESSAENVKKYIGLLEDINLNSYKLKQQQASFKKSFIFLQTVIGIILVVIIILFMLKFVNII